MEDNKYAIKITPKAYEDKDEVFGYIASNLPLHACNLPKVNVE